MHLTATVAANELRCNRGGTLQHTRHTALSSQRSKSPERTRNVHMRTVTRPTSLRRVLLRAPCASRALSATRCSSALRPSTHRS